MDTERDGYGRPVPRRLADVFAGRRELANWCRDLEQLRDRLLGLAAKPFGEDLDADSLRRGLEAVRIMVVLQMPLEPCGCEVNERDCPRCKGRRWTTVSRLASAGDSPA